MRSRSGGLFFAAALCAAIILPALQVRGQVNDGAWTNPEIVFQEDSEEECVWLPMVVADPAGNVHLFWSYKDPDSPHTGGNLIGYARFDDDNWSEANMILASPRGESTDNPVAAFDPSTGSLHVMWIGIGPNYSTSRVYHSYAHTDRAWSAQAWTPPEIFPTEGDTISTPWFTFDETGVMHIVFETTQGAFYTRSTDQGTSWAEPTRFFDPSADSAVKIFDLQMDARGRLHTVVRCYVPGTLVGEIFYSHSSDGGNTWLPPLALSDNAYYNQPSLITIGRDKVHVLWNGSGSDSGRYHRWSTDGGTTWSKTETILPAGGFAGKPGLIVDGDGTLHLITAGNAYDRSGVVIHTYWEGNDWARPELLPLSFYAEHATVACRGGDQLVVAGDGKTPGSQGFDMIWVSTTALSVPHISPQAIPTAVPTHAPTPTTTAPTPTALASQPPEPQGQFSSDLGPGSSVTTALMWGIVPAALLVAVVILASLWRRKKR